MDSQSMQLILEKLSELAQAAGGLGEEAWPFLVRQAVVEGWCSLAIVVFTAIICILSADLGALDDWDSFGLCIIAILSALGLLIGGAFFFCEGLPRILNPEYYAIKDLLSLVR